ncbi:RNA polymerase sigma-70 factor, ECF subfamily [Reichenbachiella agariperforans]|uniref:RNA polymerase sigma-70 factor, ECF subfamily n=2 Tax=Reichenbachiella agariperforans TaxID=156994 RepID=A0A1M6JYH3_REIAG|nr:RNA polymerase sigma-70 factor, ECF subfamily [Reichenbachiella agariperforans]
MIIDHDETADLLQDTFIKIWEKLDSFKGDAQFYTWVYRIAINHCLQHLKKQKRRRMWSTGYEEEKIAQLQATPSISGDEIQLKLQKAILKLPDKQRLVFNLKYYEDMSYDQIARITNTTSGALRATYHHAVKKIEKMIQMDT